MSATATSTTAASAAALASDVSPASAQAVWTLRDGWRYGLLGLPLAFVALPLYVILPNHYAKAFGVPLATLGAVLLGARLFDAFIDPWLGRVTDALFARSHRAVLRLGAVAAVALALGFVALFFPPVRGDALVLWASAMLVVTYAAYSAVSVAHQSWGARLGGDELQRSRIVAWREGLGLAGVLLASVLPIAFDLHVSTAVFCVALAAGVWAWTHARVPVLAPQLHTSAGPALWLPFTRPAFRKLLTVFVLNGIASAIPATLVLFFIQDKLQAPKAMEGVFLAAYFLAAAMSIPLWLRSIARWGLARVWLCGMLLAVAVFAWASQLGVGDVAAFMVVCALSGVALGADLGIPSALLAGVIQRSGDSGHSEGAYFGWWNFATKLNLALAAGLALPLLSAFGYAPGARDSSALQALVIAYCVLPCALKLIAAHALFYWAVRQKL
jgi:glycoside/pentoside/hexuronide:cation symporter, GPH family